jgi:YHS domain-containing protein
MTMKRDTEHIRFFFAVIIMCALMVSASAQSAKKEAGESARESESHHHTAGQAQDAQKGEKQFLGRGDGIETCPVMGGPVDKDLKFEWKGHTYYVCCSGCIDTIKKDPELYLKPPKKEGAGSSEQEAHRGHQDSGDQAKPAGESKFLGKGDGIETCPVTGEPVDKEFKEEILGRTVYVCCPGCFETIKKNPELYLKKQ